MNDVALVLTTIDTENAEELVTTLLERRLVACVSTHDITSSYRWLGELHREVETQLVCKSTLDRAAEVGEAIRELHPYDLPEVMILEARASAAYAEWVGSEVAPGA